MKEIVRYNKLFDAYKKLLKTDEVETFSDYYEEDLSLQEIADNLNISKSAVGKKISNIEKKLEQYEDALNILKKTEILESLLDEEDIEKIKKKISIIIK